LYDVLIIGGGPAGLSAAIYAGRARLKTAVIEKAVFGGNIFQTAEIANYPGGMHEETGAEFAARMEAHARLYGAELVFGDVTSVRLEGDFKKITVGDSIYEGRTVILAPGCVPAKLGVTGEQEHVGYGVSYCAVCDGPFFRNLDVFVVGGGDSAVEESMHLAKFARKVTVIHRRDEFRAAKFIVEQAGKVSNIEYLMDTTVTEIGGEPLVTRLGLRNMKTDEGYIVSAAPGENFGVFVFTGMIPQTELFGDTLAKENGYILTDELMRTNIPGVFAAGDVRKKSLRQVVTATSDGAIAAVEAEKYLWNPSS